MDSRQQNTLAGRASTRAVSVSTACLTMALTACSTSPSQDIMGSYFPAWLLCGVLGVAVAVAARLLLTAIGIGSQLVAPPLTYAAMAVVVALAVWLVWFGQ